MRVACFAIALLFLAATSCRPKAPRAPDVAAPPPGEADVAPEPAPPPAPECIADRSCTGYLRCEDGKCVVPPAVDGREVDGMPTATFRSADKELATIKLEIADDNNERMRGLMHRRAMDPDFGMLFIFDRDELRSFWMKNTLLELDMVHINAAGRVVGIVERAAPTTLTPRQTGEPARYVLELIGGRAAELGIVPGVQMTVTGLPPEQSPVPETP